MTRENSNKIFLEYIVSDDGASLRAMLKHNTPTSKKGKLPDDIPEPAFLADPGHRTKTASKPIFKLVKLKKSESTCSRVEALRFKKYYAYMLKKNCDKSIKEISEAAKAVLEHLFDNHQYCDERWCHAKRRQMQTKNSSEREEGEDASVLTDPPIHPFKNSKVTDYKLYIQMKKEAFEPFLKIE